MADVVFDGTIHIRQRVVANEDRADALALVMQIEPLVQMEPKRFNYAQRAMDMDDAIDDLIRAALRLDEPMSAEIKRIST